MSDLDKTGKKLIDSIRMTKEGPATAAAKSATQKTTTAEAATPQKSPAASTAKSATRAAPKAAKKAKSTAAKRKKQPSAKKATLADVPYQDGSEVWPD